MSLRLKEAEIQQKKAVDGASSVWVSASAGTGKTYVLTKRITELLLTNFTLKPSQILAVTFTRAAAREMENRVLALLQKWQTMPEDALIEEIEKSLGQGEVSSAHLKRARQLFDLALDDAVQTNTIHGFCQHILGRFPLEAGLAPSTRVLDDIEAKLLLAQVKQNVLQKGFDGHIEPKWAVAYLAQNFGEQTLLKYLGKVVEDAGRIKRLMENYQGSIRETLNALADLLNVPKELTPTEDRLSYGEFIAAVEAFLPHIAQVKGKRAADIAGKVQNLLGMIKKAPDNVTLPEKLAQLFLTAKGEMKKASTIVTKKDWEENTLVAQLLHRLQSILGGLLDQKKARHTYLSSAAVLYLGEHVLRQYTEEKRTQNVLDFDDLIHCTADLLQREEARAWVQFKLDQHIRHVLLDEAQDTDRTQWHIIRSFVDEFYAGEGQSEGARTFFSVGDMKQSIYRFRGAEPFVFDDMRRYLKKHNAQAGYPVSEAHLETSFRSSEVVLDFVDLVFASKERRSAVDVAADEIKHHAIHEGSGGHVEIWPLVDIEPEKVEEEAWTLPRMPEASLNARRVVAEKVAASIEQLLGGKEVLESTGACVQPEDVMILLQKRTFLTPLVAALDALKIPHTGADVIDLNASPLVADLLQLMRLSCVPEDAFARAQVLKSPLFSWPDSALFDTRKSQEIPFELKAFLNMHRSKSVYAFLCAAEQAFYIKARYSQLYDAQQVETTFHALLDQALTWAEPQGFLGFIQQMMTVQQVVKRQLSGVQGRVRILTAHGSKGLEAPIVYMPDAGIDMYADLSKESFLWSTTDENQDNAFITRLPVSTGEACQKQLALAEEEKERVFKDKLRLLYVALTRAKDRLYIGGEGKGGASTWHGQICDALVKNAGDFVQLPSGVWQCRRPVRNANQSAVKQVQRTIESIGRLPLYFKEDISFEQPLEYIKASLSDTSADLLTLKKTENMGFVYGETVHKLLEILPKYAPEERQSAGVSYVRQRPLNAVQQKSALDKSLSIIQALPELFDPDKSQGEVAVMSVKEGKYFEGVVDRLVVKEDVVWVIDYKTDKNVPTSIPLPYENQLNVYMWALADVYPDKEIKAGIVWVNEKTPQIQWLQSTIKAV